MSASLTFGQTLAQGVLAAIVGALITQISKIAVTDLNINIGSITAILPEPVKAALVFVMKTLGLAVVVLLIMVLWILTVALISAATVAFARGVWATIGGIFVVGAAMLVALAGLVLIWLCGYMVARANTAAALPVLRWVLQPFFMIKNIVGACWTGICQQLEERY